MSEQGNELRTKNEVAAKPETNTMTSNPDVEECTIESEEKIEEAGKLKVALAPPVEDNEKSKELEKAGELKRPRQSKNMNWEPKIMKQQKQRPTPCLQCQMKRNGKLKIK